MSVHIFGIRHHGPGCARSLLSALQTLNPAIVLVEGPPDAESVLPFLTRAEMKPPVAILIYPVAEPQRAVFYPFATFSPEWQALHYAGTTNIPARFIDLPQANRLAEVPIEKVESAMKPDSADDDDDEPESADGTTLESTEPSLQDDPLGALALAAGYQDRELWWEHQIEQRQDPTGLFEGIMEAMTALRAKAAKPPLREEQREAFMRESIRAAIKEGFDPIAVVCGAWHAPALADLKNAGVDRDVLKGLPKTKVAATWVPWTYSRLSYRSGYGAGVSSPGWYDHLWHHTDKLGVRWSTHVARLLRDEDLDASSASVIETVRLAEALAGLRNLPMPGLAEFNEAVLTVLCSGNPTPMRLIEEKLIIGDRLGEVPKDTPAVPLQKDLESKQKQLRLKPTTEIVSLDLDLRKEFDRDRSSLLHQLRLLGIEWGKPQKSTGKLGTFHELWQIKWEVEFVVAIVEASIWGNTIEQAASSSACSKADKATDLPALTELLDGSVVAGLKLAIEHILECLQKMAAISADVRHMMDALPAMARVARYGDVRGTSATHIAPIIDGLFERIIIGLPGACASLDDDAAARMVTSIGNVQQTLDLLDTATQRSPWQILLRRLVDNDSIHGFVRGSCCRLLLEQLVITGDEVQKLAGLALSPAMPVAQAASWIEGLLRGSGLLLLNQDSLWQALDQWLGDLAAETFVELLPVIRRAFAEFQQPELRAMAEKVKKLKALGGTNQPQANAEPIDSIHTERAARVLPILAHILGVKME